MYRIDGAAVSGTLPTPAAVNAPGYFTEGNPGGGVPATVITADWLNMVQEELVAAAILRGASLSKSTASQLAAVLIETLVVSAAAASGAVSGQTTPRSRGSLCSAGTNFAATAGKTATVGCDAVSLDGQTSGAVGCDDSIIGGSGAVSCGGLAARDAIVEGDQSAAVASFGAEITGQGSAVVATGDGTTDRHLVSGVNSAIIGGGNSTDTDAMVNAGDRCVMAAVDNCNMGGGAANCGMLAARDSTITGTSPGNSAIVGSFACTLDGDANVIAASNGCVADSGSARSAVIASLDTTLDGTLGAAAIGCDGCTVSSSQPSALMASTNAELATNNAVAGGWSVTPLTPSGSDQNLTWLIDSTTGDIYTDGTAGAGAADYAEFFQNCADGVIPIGSLVTLDGGEVRLAQQGERILGVVSAAPAVLGNAAGLQWAGRWERDAFGAVVKRAVPCVSWGAVEHWETVKIPVAAVEPVEGAEPVEPEFKTKRIRTVWRKAYSGPVAIAPWMDGAEHGVEAKPDDPDLSYFDVQAPVESPDYDASKPYSPRKDRPEQWTAVGLLGQLAVRCNASVTAGDDLHAGAGGLAERDVVETLRKGAQLQVLRILSPYDDARGYAVALCMVR